MALVACAQNPQPASNPHVYEPDGTQPWCYQLRAVGLPCRYDSIMRTADWPDEAIVCVDLYAPDRCFTLGALREWASLHSRSRLAVD